MTDTRNMKPDVESELKYFDEHADRFAEAHRGIATPQPAPDAMRLAGIRLWNAAKAVAFYRPLAKQVCHVPTALMYELVDALVFSSAPVPSSDGLITTEQLDQLQFGRSLHTRPLPDDGAGEPFKTCPGCEMRQTCMDVKHCYGPSHAELKERFALPSAEVVDSGSLAHAQAAIERQKNAPPNIDALAADLVAAGEVEYSGAAEPGKRWYVGAQNDGLFIINAEPRPSNDHPWHDNPNGPTVALNVTELPLAKAQKVVNVMNAHATPPVKADREAIARIIGGDIFGSPDSAVGPATQAARRDALAKADAILSVPVQPGAGEREALCELLRQFICEFWIDKPQMMWERTRCDDGLEMVHHQGDTIFFGDPNHKEPPDTARFKLIVELANATPKLLRALSPPCTSEKGSA